MKKLPQLVLAIAGSKDKMIIYDKLYNPDNNLFLFDVVSQGNHRLLKTILTGNDQDRTDFLNKRNKKLDTLLHVAVENGFAETATLLLGADVRMELNGQNHTPAIENFFKTETADQVTPELVKALIRKVRMNLFDKKEADRLLGLKKSNNKHLFELVDTVDWNEVCHWRDVGFIHVLENPRLAKALIEWFYAVGPLRSRAEDGVKECMNRGGNTMGTMTHSDSQVEEMAANAWNDMHAMKCKYQQFVYKAEMATCLVQRPCI